MGLYGLEEVLGRMVEDTTGRRKFVYYPDAGRLRALFWEELGAEAPELVYNPVIRARVEMARLLGLLLWYVTPLPKSPLVSVYQTHIHTRHGIVFDKGRLGRVVEQGRDNEELQKLDLFLFGPTGPAMLYAQALEAAPGQA
jgi:hypothetical protein